jgi:hypothetical protein
MTFPVMQPVSIPDVQTIGEKWGDSCFAARRKLFLHP